MNIIRVIRIIILKWRSGEVPTVLALSLIAKFEKGIKASLKFF